MGTVSFDVHPGNKCQQSLKLKEIRLPSSQHVKYMPAGYKKKQTKLTACPAPSTSSAGGGFNLWTFMTSGVVAATIAGNIINNINSNNNNNNNNNNQDSQNNNNQIFNNNDNSNMNVNMVSMAMGRGGRMGGLYSVLCHLLTLYLTGQGEECVDRVLCQAAPSNVSDLNTFLIRMTSITAGLIASDYSDKIDIDGVFDALHTDKTHCHAVYPCI